MGYIIDTSYFPFIPNTDELNTDAFNNLNRIIDSKVRLFLRNALGVELFNDLDANITDGILNDNADQKYKDLVNGKVYQLNGTTYHWQGLIYIDGTQKQSLLIPFVYYHWLLNNQSTLSGVGSVVLTAKNATNVNITETLTTTWNSFLEQYQGNQRLNANPYNYFYRGVEVVDWLGGYNSGYVSLVNFLNHNSKVYNAKPKYYKTLNQLGL